MTPLEQKAREYANNQMRCYKCSDHQAPCKDNKCVNWHRCFKGYKQGYTEALRWRDVNEELPPFENVPINERTKYLVKVCTGSMTPKVDIRIWCLSNPYKWIGEMDWVSVTHWRAIETI